MEEFYKKKNKKKSKKKIYCHTNTKLCFAFWMNVCSLIIMDVNVAPCNPGSTAQTTQLWALSSPPQLQAAVFSCAQKWPSVNTIPVLLMAILTFTCGMIGITRYHWTVWCGGRANWRRFHMWMVCVCMWSLTPPMWCHVWLCGIHCRLQLFIWLL